MTAEEELHGGIRNALERGVQLEKVIQTFINAGYQDQVVRAAARAVTEGATTIAPRQPSENNIPNKTSSPVSETSNQNPDSSFSFPSSPMQVPIEQQNTNPNPNQNITLNQNTNTNQRAPLSNIEPKKTINVKIIALAAVLFLLLALLAASLLFREQILGMFE